MSSTCSYNCTSHPLTLTPYPDVTGTGVLIGYVGTAALAVLVIVVNYTVSYDPKLHPFRDKDGVIQSSDARDFRPNSVDLLILDGLRYAMRRLSKNEKSNKNARELQIDKVLSSSILMMSDLQTLTGLSILISGYAQLRCGLTCFHWQLIIYLAWFCSLTHQACLTFLRNFLYNRPTQRLWRLVCMFILVILQVIAMVPSGNFDWPSGFSLEVSNIVDRPPIDGKPYFETILPDIYPSPLDYAICHFWEIGHDISSYVAMIMSLIFIAFGFLWRVVRLHKYLFISFVKGCRNYIGRHVRNGLLKVVEWSPVKTQANSISRLFIYRPLFALFILGRIISELWSSMFIEVIWLVGGYIWGLLNLISVSSLSASGGGDWTFGQVIPVLMLCAPLLTMFGYFFDEKKSNDNESETTEVANQASLQTLSRTSQDDQAANSPPGTQSIEMTPAEIATHNPASPARVGTLQMAFAAHQASPDGVMDSPEFEKFENLDWYREVTLFCCLVTVMHGLQLVIIYPLNHSSVLRYFEDLSPLNSIWTTLPISLVSFVLNALLIEALVQRGKRFWTPKRQSLYHRIMKSTNFGFALMCQARAIPVLEDYLFWSGWAVAAVYFFCAISYRIFG